MKSAFIFAPWRLGESSFVRPASAGGARNDAKTQRDFGGGLDARAEFAGTLLLHSRDNFLTTGSVFPCMIVCMAENFFPANVVRCAASWCEGRSLFRDVADGPRSACHAISAPLKITPVGRVFHEAAKEFRSETSLSGMSGNCCRHAGENFPQESLFATRSSPHGTSAHNQRKPK